MFFLYLVVKNINVNIKDLLTKLCIGKISASAA